MTETVRNTDTLRVATPSDREVAITRVFDAPRRLVFAAYTRPEHVRQWMLGRADWTMPVCEIDLRPGGAYRYVWNRPERKPMEIRGVYKEIAPPERLVFTDSWGGDWPETVNTLVLTEEDGKTTLTLTMLYPSREARDAALGTGMKDGASGGFDRLDKYLQTIG